MKPSPMTRTHQETTHHGTDRWTARLEPGAALTLRAAAEPRALAVHEGRIWATRRVERGRAEDLWLAAGERLELPPGSEWVLEAWPAARVSLLAALPVPGVSAAAPWQALRAWWPRRVFRPRRSSLSLPA
jgi:hypothetical protein